MINQKSVLFQIILSYILIGSILIAFLAMFLSFKFSDHSTQEIIKVSENSLELSAQSFASKWGTVFEYMYKEFKTNPTLITARVRTDLTPIDYGTISYSLRDIKSNINLFESIYIYNRAADLVFSTIGPVKSASEFYDQNVLAYFNEKAQVDQLTDHFVSYRDMHMVNGTTVIDKNVISVIFSDDHMESAIIFTFKEAFFQEMMLAGENNNSQAFFIVNQDGQIISRSHTNSIYSTLTDEELMNLLMNKEDNGYFKENIHNRESLIIYNQWQKNSNMIWTFISISEYNQLISPIKKLQQYVLIITSVFILASALIAAHFTTKIYFPINRLLSKLQFKLPKEQVPRMNEYDYLDTVYESMSLDLDNFKNSQNYHRRVLKQQLLTRLIQGEYVRDEEWQHVVLNLSLDEEKFRVCVIRIDDVKKLVNDKTRKALNLYRYAIGNMAEEIMGELLPVEILECGEEHMAIIQGESTNNELLSKAFHKKLEQLQQACLTYLQLSITIGIGTWEEGLRSVHLSYIKAMDTSHYRLVYGKGQIMSYKSIVPVRNHIYLYPIEHEKLIMDALKACDENKVRHALDQFVEHIVMYTADEILLAFNQLEIVTERTLKQLLEPKERKELGIKVDNRIINKQMDWYDTILDRVTVLYDTYKRAISGLMKKKEAKYGDIVVRVQQHIHENYSDCNLSVDLLAKLVNLSPNYLRLLFKEQLELSISNYISDIRFQKAKLLLRTTDYPVSKISEMIGFQGSGYFYTAFKKKTGTTPDEYRRAAAEGNKDDTALEDTALDRA